MLTHIRSYLHIPKRKPTIKLVGMSLAFAFILAACQATYSASVPNQSIYNQPTAQPSPTQAVPTQPAPTATVVALTPSVTVSVQPIVDGKVTIADVVSHGPGWIVIHAQANGKPGAVIGDAAVLNGDNKNVPVTIDSSKATPILYAMLHVDAGTVGTYEFPGADVPVQVNGQVVTPAFKVTGGLATATPLPAIPAAAAPTSTLPASSGTVKVMIIDSSFNPAKITVPAGTTVLWVNNGLESHTVTASNGAFDSGALAKGDAFQFTFTTPGTYHYYCKFHGTADGNGMAGLVVVTGGY